MIRSFADDATRESGTGVNSRVARQLPRPLWPVIRRKLDQLDIVFRFEGHDAHDVGRTDYH